MLDYISENPQFIVNGFIYSGILRALNTIDNDNMMKNAHETNQVEVENYLDKDEAERLGMHVV